MGISAEGTGEKHLVIWLQCRKKGDKVCSYLRKNVSLFVLPWETETLRFSDVIWISLPFNKLKDHSKRKIIRHNCL